MPPSHTILLVDDNLLVLEMMSKALNREGFRCMKASSAIQAMELLGKEIPDIILSDYDMPDTNGFLFRQQLMNNPDFRNIPFMFLTSMNNTDLMLEGINMEAIDYIIKDVPIPVIVSKITNVLNTIREQHQRSKTGGADRVALGYRLGGVAHRVERVGGMAHFLRQA